MSPFTPAGDRARWRTVYDLLVKAETGATVTYEALGEALRLDPVAERHLIQMAIRRAAREHEVLDGRALDAVRNVGYRIVHVPEHLTLAQRHQKKAGRALERGRSKVDHVDLSGVDPDTRRAFEVVAQAFAMQAEFNKRLDIRHKRLERQVQAIKDSAESALQHTSDEVAALRERLERLEAERGGQ
jgi:hypothetical protein